MPDRLRPQIEWRDLELDGIRYVVLRETLFERLCQAAGVQRVAPAEATAAGELGLGLDRESLARRLIRRRRAAGLSQAALARRAGIRPETLNRIERGRTTPDFATVRKLVVAMNTAESEQATRETSKSSRRRSTHADTK